MQTLQLLFPPEMETIVWGKTEETFLKKYIYDINLENRQTRSRSRVQVQSVNLWENIASCGTDTIKGTEPRKNLREMMEIQISGRSRIMEKRVGYAAECKCILQSFTESMKFQAENSESMDYIMKDLFGSKQITDCTGLEITVIVHNKTQSSFAFL